MLQSRLLFCIFHLNPKWNPLLIYQTTRFHWSGGCFLGNEKPVWDYFHNFILQAWTWKCLQQINVYCNMVEAMVQRTFWFVKILAIICHFSWLSQTKCRAYEAVHNYQQQNFVIFSGGLLFCFVLDFFGFFSPKFGMKICCSVCVWHFSSVLNCSLSGGIAIWQWDIP